MAALPTKQNVGKRRGESREQESKRAEQGREWVRTVLGVREGDGGEGQKAHNGGHHCYLLLLHPIAGREEGDTASHRCEGVGSGGRN